jgi:hypothetical protein
MGSNPKPAEHLIGRSNGVHFAGLVSRDELEKNVKEELPTTSAKENGHKELREPFVIG